MPDFFGQDKLELADAIIVNQKKEWSEILTGIHAKNKYSLKNRYGQELFFAIEESSIAARFFLKNLRPFTIHLLSSNSDIILKCHTPFRFILPEINITNGAGYHMGKIVQRFAIANKIYDVLDSYNKQIYRIVGPVFHPWTFTIYKNDFEIGKISKKWSGLAKEIFTNADNFNVTFLPEIEVQHKYLLLGALFLIDMKCFEQR